MSKEGLKDRIVQYQARLLVFSSIQQLRNFDSLNNPPNFSAVFQFYGRNLPAIIPQTKYPEWALLQKIRQMDQPTREKYFMDELINVLQKDIKVGMNFATGSISEICPIRTLEQLIVYECDQLKELESELTCD